MPSPCRDFLNGAGRFALPPDGEKTPVKTHASAPATMT
ncbi:hypothetical protein CES85_5195 [Ochrobactrum quorumnocens]|uniref:Uncharacterized protein n=1 Tax=Ochrobactrum quorumnocens TaxID=271865 RepID=A0A248UDE1_9HYPH|nr:hypothetical protein CES85_5195 [[Ochrobactrum] quorumnocens]